MLRGILRGRHAPIRWWLAVEPRRGRHSGLTLIEMLVAMAITLLMMGGVITMFGTVTESISGSRATVEMSGRARAATRNLQQDLSAVTAEMLPPLRPEQGMGYFEYVEGPRWDGTDVLIPSTTQTSPKSALGDFDDILMMTVRSRGGAYNGRVVALPVNAATKEPRTVSMESAVAEVVWWGLQNGSDVVVPNQINGVDYSYKTCTLYRRVLLVGAPPETVGGNPTGWVNGRFRLDQLNGALPSGSCDPVRFFGVFDSDLSVHFELVNENNTAVWYAVANTLADLTKRENRHGHWSGPSAWNSNLPMASSDPSYYPFSVISGEPFDRDFEKLGRYAGGLQRYDDLDGNGKYSTYGQLPGVVSIDTSNLMQRMLLPLNGKRKGEDVMLDNVLAFDVRAFDPTAEVRMASGAVNERQMLTPSDIGYPIGVSSPVPYLGAYVDLNYSRYMTTGYRRSWFSEIPDFFPKSTGQSRLIKLGQPIYDTWSLHYEYNGFDEDGDGLIDEGTNSYDDPAGNIDPNDIRSTRNGGSLIGPPVNVPGVDDPTEKESPPPYSAPLRGIQVRVRQYETSTRQVRETTVSQDFMPE